MRTSWMKMSAGLLLALGVGCGSSSDGANNDGTNPGLVPDNGQVPTNQQPVTPLGPSGDTTNVGQPSADPVTAQQPTAGVGATMDPQTPTTTDAEPMPMAPVDGPVSLRGMCDLNTRFPGDEACLLPPPEGKGIQIHIGPEDYDNPGQYEFAAGRETSECVNFTLPNSEDIFYQVFELSGRQGTHHIINTMYNSPNSGADGQFAACRDPGTGTNAAIIDNLPGAAKPWMELGVVAPENENLGRRIPGGVAAQADMHYFNPTDSSMLREFWLNIWFKDPSEITDEANQIRGMGGALSWQIAPPGPGSDQVYPYSCAINAPGRITSLLGHMHSHGMRFTAWLNRGKASERKVYEVFDYLEPIAYQYDSVSQNPPMSPGAPGAVSGMLEVVAGDTLDWECHVVNDLNVPLRYTNEVVNGEMCNMWGTSVGPKIDCPFL